MPPKTKSSAKKKSVKIKEKDDKKLTESFERVKRASVRKTKNFKVTEVHKEDKVDIAVFQEILKQFDLDINYGPIIGISRTDRFKRAEYFEIPLKDNVKEILNDQNLLKKFPELDLNIWHDIDHHTYVAINKY